MWSGCTKNKLFQISKQVDLTKNGSAELERHHKLTREEVQS